MTQWKHQLEQFFATLSGRIMLHPKLTLLCFVTILIGFGQFLRFVEIDPELENFIDPSTQLRQEYTHAKEVFGRNDMVMLALRGDVLSIDFLDRMSELQSRIDTELPYINEVTSILNAPYQRGTDDTLEVLDLVESLPQTDADLQQIDRRLQESSLASEVLTNDERSMTLVMIEPATYDYGESETDPFSNDAFDDVFADDPFAADTDASADIAIDDDLPFLSQFQTMEMLAELDTLLSEYPDLSPLQAGMPVMNVELEGTMKSEMLFFLRLTVALIVLTLLAFFRQVGAVIAPMVAVLSALLLTMSLLVISGHKIQIPLVLLPSFLLAITIGDAVHLLTHFYRRIRDGDDRLLAMQHAIQRTAVPMLLTSLTTAGGLLSLVIADVVPIRNLGLFAAVGVMLAFVLTMTLIPALIMLLPMRRQSGTRHTSKLAGIMEKLGTVSWQHGGKVALLWLLAGLLSLSQIVQLRFSHDPLNWMPDDLPIVDATQVIDRELSGTMTLDVIFETGQENGVKDLTFLQTLATWQDELDSRSDNDIQIRGSSSLIDILRESNRALNGGTQAQYRLPDTQQAVNEELFLFETSAADTLNQLVDADYSQTRMTLVLPWKDLLVYSDFIDDIAEQGQTRFAQQADVSVTGMMALMGGTMIKLVYDTAGSYLLAAGIISIMMMLLLGSVRLGLLAMIPNIAPIVVVMGAMKPLGIELDMLTILVATIAIGIAVDNTVHFTHHFRHGLDLGHSVQAAMQDAFAGAGQALFTTCIVLTAGFYVFLFSDVHSIFNLGFLCGTAFILAMISNFTLTPFLLRWFYRNHPAPTASSTPAH
ncbi:efflux RND transporter permease subunit [Reinekea blandensis]|uniref:Predicted exporter of the RND superfamily protein n=1 Tax=Reinekea blandensis MED297 TaxID=314283 RepID=A4BDC7_9GAMM|nr:MMPL family transporter [Reinekea blandensis]EAR09871.1 Predicted exporter of the RND superfamily protein [Reinekea sp. MED297] [Reinekea blandensis MED297]